MKELLSQMNPHFIFNSLNAIGNSIDKRDFETAGNYLTRFEKLVRLIIENSEYREIPLANDLQVLELYLQLDAMRMKGKITYVIDLDEEVDATKTLVQPVILQHHIETTNWYRLPPYDVTDCT